MLLQNFLAAWPRKKKITPTYWPVYISQNALQQMDLCEGLILFLGGLYYYNYSRGGPGWPVAQCPQITLTL